MIDLHLHTTASDGRLTPSQLIARAIGVGLTVVSITDHDTTAALDEARAAAAAAAITLVTGIEITAVDAEQDVHVLGYFFDSGDRRLSNFLLAQRADRVRRVHEIAARLHELGLPIETRPLENATRADGPSIGRPHVADALVAAGHAVDRGDAFARLLGRGRPAFVPRVGASPAEVVSVIRNAGGVASLAHPGLTRRDDLLPALAAAGLAALEAVHSDHDRSTEDHYRRLAAQHGLAVSGGSDFHGDLSHHAAGLGTIVLPPADFVDLQARRA